MNRTKKDLTRTQKINLLNDIKGGKLNLDNLNEPITYSVIKGFGYGGKYAVSDMGLTPTRYLDQEEFEEWENRILELNKTRKNPHFINLVKFKMEVPV